MHIQNCAPIKIYQRKNIPQAFKKALKAMSANDVLYVKAGPFTLYELIFINNNLCSERSFFNKERLKALKLLLIKNLFKHKKTSNKNYWFNLIAYCLNSCTNLSNIWLWL